MKILLIHNAYGKHSGEETVVDAQIALLEKNGHDVHLYSRSSEELEHLFLGKLRAFATGLYNYRAIREVKTIIKQFNPDLVHIHNLYPIISPAILPVIKKTGLSIVMTVHNYRLLCPNGLFFTHGKVCERCTGKGKELNRVIYSCDESLPKSFGYALRNFWARVKRNYLDNIDVFLCLTEFQRSKLIQGGYSAGKCIVIPNFIDNISEIKEKGKGEYVLFAGRLNIQKGFDILVNAAKQLPEIWFKVAGIGDQNFIDNLHIPSNMTLYGECNRAQMDELYDGAAMLAFTSRSYEGFPTVFTEAMKYKVPVIAPNMAGYPEIIEHNRTGLLFEPENVKGLADAVKLLDELPGLASQFAEAAFVKLKLQYFSDVYYIRLMQVYKFVMRNEVSKVSEIKG